MSIVSPTRGRLLLLLAFVAIATVSVIALGASAETDVTEDITIDTIWDADNSPYKIGADVSVTGGSTLRILPGSEVLFMGDYSLTCDATSHIQADGLADNPITFTSGRSPAGLNDWETLNIGRGGTLRNASISYATTGLELTDMAVAIDVNLTYITTGVLMTGTGALLQNAEITSGSNAIGIMFRDVMSCIARDCVLWDCVEAIDLMGTTSSCIVQGCRIYNSINHGIGVQATGSNNKILNCTVDTARRGIRVVDDSGGTEQGGLIVAGCVLKGCYDMGIEVSLVSPTSTNLIKRCTVKGSSKGIFIEGSNSTEVTENTVNECNLGIQLINDPGYTNLLWRNNIIDCATPAVSTNSQVRWNTTGPSGQGNYWSVVTGVDNDGDGVVDGKTYMLSGLQGDYFPLIRPVDYDPPVADPGPVKKPKQHRTFEFDGSASEDNTYITDWNWTVRLPDGDVYFEGQKASAKIDVAGVFEVVLTVTDAVGLRNSALTFVNVTDGDAPAYEEILTGDSCYNGQSLNFSARIKDNVGVMQVWVMYRLGPLGQQKRLDLVDQGDGVWAGEFLVPLDLAQGVFYVMSARDAENNIGATSELTVAVLDGIPPEVVPGLPATVFTGDEAWINCTATDNRGLGTVALDYWFPGGDVVPVTMSGIGVFWSFLLDVPMDARSPLSVRFNVTDASGNRQVQEVIEIPVVDNDLPVVNIDLTDRRFHYGMPGEFRLIVNDNVGLAEVFVDLRYSGGDWEPEPMTEDDGQWVATVDIAVDRGHLLWYRFRPRDAAGNELTTPDVQIALLSQNPTIVTVPLEDAYEGTLYSLDINASDPDNMDYELQWSMMTNASWLFIDPQTGVISGTPDDGDLGIYWVNVSVSDGEGGSDFMTFTVSVHAVDSPPVVSIVSPEDGQKVGTILRITGRAEDDDNVLVWVRGRVDDGEWEDLEGTTVWSFERPAKDFSSGTHYFEVMAFDGVSESEVKSISFVVPEKKDDDDGPGAGAVATLVALAVLAAVVSRSRRR